MTPRTDVEPISPGLFRIDDEGRPTLWGGRSRSSGLTHFPRAPVCPYTGADDVDDVALPRTGTLWGWTAVTSAPPGYQGPVPFGLGVVELEDGLRVIGRISESDPAALTFGQAMEVALEEIPGPDGLPALVWAFAPAGATT